MRTAGFMEFLDVFGLKLAMFMAIYGKNKVLICFNPLELLWNSFFPMFSIHFYP